MNKKERVSKYLKEMESLIHKIIDEKKDQSFTSFDLIMLTVNTLIKEKELDDAEKFKKAGNS